MTQTRQATRPGDPPFHALAVAVTPSPTSRALLHEAVRLQQLFGAPLQVVHAGRLGTREQAGIRSAMQDAGLAPESLEIRSSRTTVDGILSSVKEHQIDLLIAGALERESLMQSYLGSVARRLLRRASCSVLLFTRPSVPPRPFRNIHALVDYTTAGEEALRVAQALALLDQASGLHLVRDYFIPGFSTVSADPALTAEGRQLRRTWQQEEEEMMRLFVRGAQLSGLPVDSVCLYGREGLETARYVREQGADLLVVTAPERELRMLDRLFPERLEHILERLPSNLLLVRGRT